MPRKVKCIICSEPIILQDEAPYCYNVCEDCEDMNDYDNGPTGHGDECYSDSDPSL
jgi:hypothetical protein